MRIYNVTESGKDRWYMRVDSRDYGPSSAPPVPEMRWRKTEYDPPPSKTTRTYTTFSWKGGHFTILHDDYGNWSKECMHDAVVTAKDVAKSRIEAWPMERWIGQCWVANSPLVPDVQAWDGEKFVPVRRGKVK